MRCRRILLVVPALLLVTLQVGAQPPVRRATTVDAVRAYPGFYHGQTVAVLGQVVGRAPEMSVTSDAGTLKLIGRELPGEGAAELRGVVYDVGRMNADDPRLITLDLRDTIARSYGDRWPRPGEEIILQVTRAEPQPPATSATTPSIRAVALAPQRYVDQRITLIGQFRGRNLFGDLPESPTSERYDFVVRSADAAVWVTGVRPRGKGFAFETTRRVDTGRWVRVAGVMKYARGLVWMEGTSIELADAPTEDVVETIVPPPPPPPLEVLFSSPSDGEVDVRPDTSIRLQFSRDLAPASLKDRIRLTYALAASPDRAQTTQVAIPVTFDYTPASRGLEIRPGEALPPLTQVTFELLDGVHGPDGARLAPFKVTFTTGS